MGGKGRRVRRNENKKGAAGAAAAVAASYRLYLTHIHFYLHLFIPSFLSFLFSFFFFHEIEDLLGRRERTYTLHDYRARLKWEYFKIKK